MMQGFTPQQYGAQMPSMPSWPMQQMPQKTGLEQAMEKAGENEGLMKAIAMARQPQQQPLTPMPQGGPLRSGAMQPYMMPQGGPLRDAPVPSGLRPQPGQMGQGMQHTMPANIPPEVLQRLMGVMPQGVMPGQGMLNGQGMGLLSMLGGF